MYICWLAICTRTAYVFVPPDSTKYRNIYEIKRNTTFCYIFFFFFFSYPERSDDVLVFTMLLFVFEHFFALHKCSDYHLRPDSPMTRTGAQVRYALSGTFLGDFLEREEKNRRNRSKNRVNHNCRHVRFRYSITNRIPRFSCNPEK